MTEVEVVPFTPELAPALVACIRRCYGETYPDAAFYDARALARSVEAGRYVACVARTGEGRVVGHLGTRLAVAGDAVAETVGGIVDPDFRGTGLLRRLGHVTNQDYLRLSLAGIRLFATTAHGRMQQMIDAAGGVATGVLLGHVPAGTQYRELDHAGGSRRIAAVVYLQRLAAMPAFEVFLPERYADWVGELYERLSLSRPRGTRHGAEAASGFFEHDARRGASLLRVASDTASRDGSAGTAPEDLSDLLRRARSQAAEVCYADVPLAFANAPAAVERLHDAGFRFGALLPGSRASESLRLQRVEPASVEPERAVLASEQEATAMRRVLADARE